MAGREIKRQPAPRRLGV